MSVRYQDYYAVLGVPRTASQDEIRRAYRQLARQKHPDVDRTPGATTRFQQLTEAYEVLKNPETRSRYDTLGAHWKEGQDFTPPPGWASARTRRGRPSAEDLGGFSSFFDTLFGGGGFDGVDEDLAERGRRARAAHERVARDVEAELSVPFETALRGGRRSFQIDDGSGAPREIEVRIPAGSFSGTTLRLRGQGQRSGRTGAGDLLLRLAVEPPPGYEVGEDGVLRGRLELAPHQAVLGARVPVRGPDGSEGTVAVPPGSSSGRVLRLRGQGLPLPGGARGDLELQLAIVVPERPTDVERRAYQELARALEDGVRQRSTDGGG
ncbi:MAG: DnaJ domain-containing protein [Planctomycetes bacterium]|nr:DnaJ domain-containing protein [Planctomycetota bacterium]